MTKRSFISLFSVGLALLTTITLAQSPYPTTAPQGFKLNNSISAEFAVASDICPGLPATQLSATRPAAQADASWALLRGGGQIVLLRHALTTPGTGDPPEFKLGDCSTQRNLSDAGRAQAARIGETFKQRGAGVGLVLSSQYCRCIDTAKLAFGTVWEEPALNSIFKETGKRDAQVAAMRKLLAAAPEAGNTVLVTHQVNISALTDLVPAMGEAVVVTPGGPNGFKVMGLLRIVE